jgi:quinol monooxygenase YgiN
MSNQQVTIVAKILAKEKKRDFIKSELLKLIAPTRAEEGCINYDLHQDEKNPNLFWFHENWTSRALLEKHLGSAHLAAYVKASEGAMEEFSVHEMTVIG